MPRMAGSPKAHGCPCPCPPSCPLLRSVSSQVRALLQGAWGEVQGTCLPNADEHDFGLSIRVRLCIAWVCLRNQRLEECLSSDGRASKAIVVLASPHKHPSNVLTTGLQAVQRLLSQQLRRRMQERRLSST